MCNMLVMHSSTLIEESNCYDYKGDSFLIISFQLFKHGKFLITISYHDLYNHYHRITENRKIFIVKSKNGFADVHLMISLKRQHLLH